MNISISSDGGVSSELAVITCHFNFSDYKAPRANLRRFLRHMTYSGVPVFGVELYLDHQQPITLGVSGWKQYLVQSNAILWQKEALLNAAARLVPKRFTKLAWIDADLSFNSLNWVHQLSEGLNDHPIVQPFERCHWTNQEGSVITTRESFIKVGMSNRWLGHPGFAMAAQRSFFDLCGLYEAGVIGNGDTILAASITRKNAIDWLSKISFNGKFGFDVKSTREHYERWAEKAYAYARLGKGVSYLEGIEVTHDWHGDRVDRQYQERCAWLSGFDVAREIEVSDHGHLCWTPEACPQRVDATKQYFRRRFEDGRSHATKERY